MAINLGAALGAAAQSGANMYLKLGEEQRQEEELNMRRQEAAYQEEQRQQERKLNEITSQTLGMGNTRVTGPNYTGVTGGIDTAEPALKTEAYTDQQKMADFKQRALAAGIPLQKVTGVSGAHRAEKYAEREEMALGFTQQVMDDIKANPTDLGAVFKKHFQEQYNEGKLPGLGDGKTADVVPMEGRTGGQAIVLKDAKGNTTKTIPLTVDTIQAMTQKWAGAMMASSSPASWWKSREEDLKSREVGVKEALVPSEIAKNKALANQANAHAGVFANVLETAKTNKAAGEAMQPFLDKLAALPETATDAERQDLMLKAATAGAQKSKDIAGLLTIMRKPDKSGDVAAWNDIDAKMRVAGANPKDIEAQRASFFEGRGYAPAAKIAILESGRNPKDGKKLSEADVDAFNRTYPNTPIDKSKLSWLTPEAKKDAVVSAVPIKNSDFSVSGGRGIYRVSGIPQTFRSRAEADTAAKTAALQSRSTQVNQALERDQ
jgi:hypothetical protein